MPYHHASLYNSLLLPTTARYARLSLLLGLLFAAITVYTLWYAENSDRDDIPPILTQLIPAGHATCQTSTVFQCSSCLHPPTVYENETEAGLWEFNPRRDSQNEGLRQDQCNSAFPGLFEDVYQGVTHWAHTGPITTRTLDSITLANGMTRAMIYNGQLYVLESKSAAEDHRRKTVAVLSAMHRALAAAHDKEWIPNIEFVFSIEDMATDVTNSKTQPLWVLARKAHESSFFLMPDFGFWAWDNMIDGKNNEIGPYDEVVEKAVFQEQHLDFDEKEPLLIWRGKLSFAPKLRRALLDASRGADWNDIKEINWSVKNNFVSMGDHCRYMFIAHVEGRSYSASLKYRQACRSVIVAHKLQYIQHHHYLLVSDGPQQNYVEVERDFSDLPRKMEELIDNPDKARMIADNSVRTFRERYLTPAAEACYWRSLWQGYSQVSDRAHLWHDSTTGKQGKRGMRYETFVLLSSQEMLDFKVSSG